MPSCQRGVAPPRVLRNSIVVRVDVPGLTEKDLHVSVDNGVLTISGEREGQHESKDDDYYYAERCAGSFSRSLMLPSGIEADGINAKMKERDARNPSPEDEGRRREDD
jgi:HSP20 family protein